jgi:dTDP-4-amino-4,6-dideoxygalactose transaminase
VQTSVLYPAIHEFTSYAAGQQGLERSELAARTELTLPLYPHLTEADQDRVVGALADGLRELAARTPVGSTG